MSQLNETLEKYGRQAAENLGLYLFSIEIKNLSSKQPIIFVTADSEAGITIGECTALSRELSDLIDSYELISADYRLDVTSPGMSVPMQYDWQFKRAVGKKVRIFFNLEDKKKVEGLLESYSEKKYELKVGKKNEIIEIDRSDVKEIKVIPQW